MFKRPAMRWRQSLGVGCDKFPQQVTNPKLLKKKKRVKMNLWRLVRWWQSLRAGSESEWGWDLRVGESGWEWVRRVRGKGDAMGGRLLIALLWNESGWREWREKGGGWGEWREMRVREIRLIYIGFFGNFAFKWVRSGPGSGCVSLKLAPDLNSLRVLF